jgi:Putative restriction endonuclease
MWGLEYPLLFGLPNNKLELIEGKTRCAFPFRTRSEAEAHLTAWAEKLCQWKGVITRPVIEKGDKTWSIEAAGFVLELFPLPMDLRIPFKFETFRTIYSSFWQRDLWDEQPSGCESGWESVQRHHDVRLNLWVLFQELCKERGWLHAGNVDLSLTDTSAVAPDQYLFCRDRDECMIAGDYFRGAPDLVLEILSPASRALDRGPRKELYRRAGVPHLWLLEPETETVEVYELSGCEYRLVAINGAGDVFRPLLFPDVPVVVDSLFDTQWKRHQDRFEKRTAEPVPAWLLPKDERLGLEHLLLLGHPDRRHEIWNNRAPCMLAFGSPEEARARFTDFVEDACRWEQLPLPRAANLEEAMEQAEVGRFRLSRQGRQIWLEVSLDASKYRQLLELWVDAKVWDWGEE